MLNRAFFLILGFLVGAPAYGLSLRYSLPSPDAQAEVLVSPLKIYQTSLREVAERGIFGIRTHKPLRNLLREDHYIRSLHAELEIEALNQEDYFYFQTVGVPVFFPVRSNYVDRIKADAATLELPLSSLRFDQEEGNWSEIRYDLFYALEELAPLAAGDIREDFRGNFDSYLQIYGRKDSNFDTNSAPTPGLNSLKIKGVNTGKKSGYVFSACIIFREVSISDRPRQDADCFVYSLSERRSLLPIIAGRRLRSQPQALQHLYLVERTRRERNSTQAERAWTKVSLPSSRFVSLENSNWKNLER